MSRILLIACLLSYFAGSTVLRAATTDTFPFNDLNRSIPDGSGSGISDRRTIASTITTLQSVRVRLHISGSFNGDLYGYLRLVRGSVTNFCVLLNRPGRTAAAPNGYPDSGLDVTFDDAAPNGDIHLYRSTVTPAVGSSLTGSWQPDGRTADPDVVLDTSTPRETFAEFVGADPNGDWTLFLADDSLGATHQLVRWELEITGDGPVPTGFEADVAPRPDGSNTGTVTITDWVQVGRFAAGLDLAAVGGEFQRADCAPRETRGNGAVTITDWVQAGRYAAGLDPILSAGGPTAPGGSIPPPPAPGFATRSGSLPRTVLLSGVPGVAPNRWIARIGLFGNQDEGGLGFSLRYDPSVLRFLQVRAVGGASGATTLVNQFQASQGLLGVALALRNAQTLGAGAIAEVEFEWTDSGAMAPSLGFGDQPVPRELATAGARAVAAAFELEPASTPLASLKLETTTTGIRLSWPAQGGDVVLESTDRIGQGSWLPVTGATRGPTGEFTLSIQPTQASRFYRLRRVVVSE